MTSSQTAGRVPPFGAGSFGSGGEFNGGFKDGRFAQDDPFTLRAKAGHAMAGSTPEQVMARLELLAHILDTAIVLPAMPLAPTGKIDKLRLRATYAA